MLGHIALVSILLLEFIGNYLEIRRDVFLSQNPSDGTCPEYFFSDNCCKLDKQSPSYKHIVSAINEDNDIDEERWISYISITAVNITSRISDTDPFDRTISAKPVLTLPKMRFQCIMFSPSLPDLAHVNPWKGIFEIDETISANSYILDVSIASILSALAVNLQAMSLDDLVLDLNDKNARSFLQMLFRIEEIDLATKFYTSSYYGKYYVIISHMGQKILFNAKNY